MSETGSALRATSDELIQDLERLASLEREKRQMTPDDPRMVAVASEVEALALRVLGRSVRQRQLTEDARDDAQAGGTAAPQRSIAATPREIHMILAEWRDAERRASEAPTGSAEAKAAEAEIDHLRDEYRQAHEDARRKK